MLLIDESFLKGSLDIGEDSKSALPMNVSRLLHELAHNINHVRDVQASDSDIYKLA